MDFDDEVDIKIENKNEHQQTESVEKISETKNNCFEFENYFSTDNDSYSITFSDNSTISSRDSIATDNTIHSSSSTGNASTDTIDVYEIDTNDITFNYRGPKVLPRNETPVTIALCDTIGTLKSRKLFRVLLDSGSNGCLIKRSALPTGIIPRELAQTKHFNTLAGKLSTSQMVTLRDVRLPEFDKNRRISQQRALIFDNDNCKYDIIFGTDFLSKTGIKFDYSSGEMSWFDNVIPMRPSYGLTSTDFDAMEDQYFIQTEDEIFGEDWLDCFATEILDAKYDKTDVTEIVNDMNHLSPSQKKDLLGVLARNKQMFDGTLGVYPHKKFHIEIDPDAKPVYQRPYAVPRVHLTTFKKELDHLVTLGVLKPQQESEWASGTFIIPKKDGRVRWISDLRQLNKVIKRRQYPLPIINDILRKRLGYKFFTKLDISMQYYTFELDEESQDLCTISTPFGMYKYARLPMGLKCSPDFAQATMENVLRGIEDCDVYIDDIGAFSNDWQSHIKLLDEILKRLRENGFTINPLKCEWAVKETDWLGYWLTPRGLKPWKKKIDAILRMDRPRNATELRMFIGAVNYYRDMWPSRAHILQPLTDQSGLKKGAKLNWTPAMQMAFNKMRYLMAADALAASPDHNKRFDIYTDASDFQLGAAIVQEGRIVAYYSRKLNKAQKNYTTMEKEMLAIVATLEEFRSMLLGANIHVWTDHKNLTFDTLKTQRVLRWRNKVEEFSPQLHYIEGPKNILADNLSRLQRLITPAQLAEGKNLVEPITDDEEDNELAFLQEIEHSGILDNEIQDSLECYLNLPESDSPEQNPLSYAYIREKQQADAKLLGYVERFPNNYIYKCLDDDVEDIICYVKDHDDPTTQWKIALPESMLKETVQWFHVVMGHPGQTRLRNTLNQRYHHHLLRQTIDKYRCEHCLRHKLPGKGYGLLPERDLRMAPWEEVAIDLIGPWKIKVRGKVVEFNALTCIDTASNLVELIRIDNKTAAHIKSKFVQSWLSRYPRPIRCVHDKGGEFIGQEFQWLLNMFSIKDVQSTAKNPQSNSICERMHQTVGNVLRTILHSNPPANMTLARDIVDEALATAMHAMRTTVATTLGSTPGALAFSRDMFLNIPLVADWQSIVKHRQQFVDDNLRRANKKRRHHDYVSGQKVLKKVHDPTKLGVRTEGPYIIERVHVNGNLTIKLREGVTERINIRRVIPYC